MAGTSMLDLTGQWIHEQVEAQPWWKTYSNTVTTAVGCAVTLAAWVASQEWARDDARVQAVVLVLGFLGTVVGVKSTPNGWSPSQVAQVTNARASFISDVGCQHMPQDIRAVTTAVDAAPDMSAGDLTALIDAHNRREQKE